MADYTPRSNGRGIEVLLEETPTCTPIPQASSTADHRSSESVSPVKKETSKVVYSDIHLKEAIGGLETLASTFRKARSQFSEQQNILPSTSNENECQIIGSSSGTILGVKADDAVDSDADSSLGILKVDDLPGLTGDELDNREVADLISDSSLTDLAVDIRHRLQKELAQRAIDRFSLLSYQSATKNVDLVDKNGTWTKNMQRTSDSHTSCGIMQPGVHFKDSVHLKEQSYTNPYTKKSSEEQISENVNNLNVSLGHSEISEHVTSFLETFRNPFDDSKLDSEEVGKMAALMIDFSAEEFISGDKCEAKLTADESVWKKENIPPACGSTSITNSKFDFSGIIGDAEISVGSQHGYQNRRVSVGEFFRLKSEQLGDFGKKPNGTSYFEMRKESPMKKHKLFPLVEVDTDEDENKKISNPVNESRMYKSSSLSESRTSSASEQDPSIRESLSLSCIADILANVNTCASPRTVVSDILKQSGLCSSKRPNQRPFTKTSVSQTSPRSSLSDVNVNRILKDTSNVNSFVMNPDTRKVSISPSKNNVQTSISVLNSECDVVKICSETSENLAQFSRPSVSVPSNLRNCSSYDGDGSESSNSVISEENSKGWIFSMPNGSNGIGAKLCSSDMKINQKDKPIVIPGEDRNCIEVITLEDSIASGDLSVLKLDKLKENRQLDESVVYLAQELASMPRMSVDCSALVSTLKTKCPQLWRQEPDCSMKSCLEISDHKSDSSVQWIDSDRDVPSELLESRIKAQSTRLTYPASFSELPENKWVSITIPESPPVICVGVPYDVSLSVRNVTDHWILCGLELDQVTLIGEEVDVDHQVALVQLPPKKVLMDPHNCKEAKVQVVPLCEGELKISLKLHLDDIVTKAVQSTSYAFNVKGEEPEIVITKNRDSDKGLDFGMLPEECAREIVLTVRNCGSVSIPLMLATIHQVPDKLATFVILDPEKQKNKDKTDSEVTRELMFTLKAGEALNSTIIFAAPPLKLLTKQRGFVRLSGVLSLQLNGIMPVELESFNLNGYVGTTALGLFRPAIPMELIVKRPGEVKTCQLPMRNNGLVPFNLTLELIPSDEDTISITVEPKQVQLEPGEQVAPQVKFTSSTILTEPVVRILQITMQPEGPSYFVQVSGIMTASDDNLKKFISKTRSEQFSPAVKDTLCAGKQKSVSCPKTIQLPQLPQSSKGNSSRKSRGNNNNRFSVKSACSSHQSSAKLHNDEISTARPAQNTYQSSIKSRHCNCQNPIKLQNSDTPVMKPESDSSKSTTKSKKSSCSSTSGEKPNVRTTHRELVWGSIAVGKNSTKLFVIRNEERFNVEAFVQVVDELHAYELIDSEGNVMKEKSIILQPMKSQSFHVNFKPQATGAAYARLEFTIHSSKLIIPLYGVGGHARLIAKGVPRDGAGRMWLMLYQHPYKKEWETSFSIRNLGDLKAFIKIKSISKGFQNVDRMSLTVDPSELTVLEGGSAKIKVMYRPQHQDLKLLMSNSMQDVVEVAALSLVSGDEATRHRLRRIHEENLKKVGPMGNTELMPQNACLDLAPLCVKFQGELNEAIPNIALLKDPQDSAVDLYKAGVNHQEIILLLENATDGHGVDSSRAFQSMYQYVVDLSTIRNEEDTDCSFKSEVRWDVSPTTVKLQPPHVQSATILLKTYKGIQRHPFEAIAAENPPGFVLAVTPNAGFIPPKNGVELTITCIPVDKLHSSYPNIWKGVIKVYIENDLKELNVRVHYPPYHKKQEIVKKSSSGASFKCASPPRVEGEYKKLDFQGVSTPCMKSISSATTMQNKLFNSAALHLKATSGNRKRISSPLSFKKMFVLGADYPNSPPLSTQHKSAEERAHYLSVSAVDEESPNLERLANPKVLSPYKQTKSRYQTLSPSKFKSL